MSYHKMKDVVLKDGQSAELGVVIAPEADWQKRLCAYLAGQNPLPGPRDQPLRQGRLGRDGAATGDEGQTAQRQRHRQRGEQAPKKGRPEGASGLRLPRHDFDLRG